MPAASASMSLGSSTPLAAVTKEVMQDKASVTDYKISLDRRAAVGLVPTLLHCKHNIIIIQ